MIFPYLGPVSQPQDNKSTRLRPLALALLSAALFGAATPIGKSLLRSLSPYQLAGLLYLGASLGVLPALMASRRLRNPWSVGQRSRRLLTGAVVFGGILAPVLMLLGLRLASAASVSLWLPLELVATATLGHFVFREHLGPFAIAGLVGVLVAGVLLGIGEGMAGLSAGILVCSACLCWGIDNNCSATIDGLTPTEITFWKGLSAGITNLVIGIAVAPWVGTNGAMALAIGVGVLCYGLSIVLYITAAQSIGATRGQMFFATAPFFGVVVSAVSLGESVSALQLAAAGVLGLSLILVFKDQHAHRHQHAVLDHEHSHRHDDGHHMHHHLGLHPSQRHSHPHRHEAISHTHPHWPDLHHRHEHLPQSPRDSSESLMQ